LQGVAIVEVGKAIEAIAGRAGTKNIHALSIIQGS
jgi:hypothetical protein